MGESKKGGFKMDIKQELIIASVYEMSAKNLMDAVGIKENKKIRNNTPNILKNLRLYE